jgi:hypothetical protein
LTVSRAGQGEERRAMTGSLCGEVVEALALTAALSIDPDATLTLDPAEDDQAEVATEPEPPGDEIPDPASKSHESPSPVEPARVSVGPLFSLARILDDSPHLGVGAVISLSKQSDAVWFPLEFRLSLESLFETKRGDAPRILTSIFSSRLSYCPLRVGASTAILLCPFSELAVIAARADGYEDAEQVDRSYFALGTELWLRTRPTRHVELSFVPGLAVPLTVRKFAVQPNEEVVVSTVDLAWSVSLIAAYRF